MSVFIESDLAVFSSARQASVFNPVCLSLQSYSKSNAPLQVSMSVYNQHQFGILGSFKINEFIYFPSNSFLFYDAKTPKQKELRLNRDSDGKTEDKTVQNFIGYKETDSPLLRYLFICKTEVRNNNN